MSGRTLHRFLLGLAREVLAAVTAEEFDPSTAYRVGVELVAAHFTEVAALHRTVAVLGAQLTEGAAARAGGAARLAEVLGALAAGYAQALQDRTRTEQQGITAAAFAARVAADIDNACPRVHRLGHLMHVAHRGNPGTQIKELIHAQSAQVQHRPTQKRPVVPQNHRQTREGFQRLLPEHPIGLEIVRSAQVIVVHPGHARPARIDLDGRPTRSVHRHPPPHRDRPRTAHDIERRPERTGPPLR